MPEIRLQRFLAQAGAASRRKAEELILAGRVRVNGRVVRLLGTKVDPAADKVELDRRRLYVEDHAWILLNKPAGTVSTADDPEGRTTVLELVGEQGVRLYPVGRLDYHTEGVLLLTNDGELANALMHPRNQVPRIYHVKVKGIIDPDLLDRLREGVVLQDTGERAKAVAGILGTTGKHTWIEITLREGRNRQIHRMLDAVDLTVLKLIRVAYAGLTAEGLPPGRFRSLTQGEINQLRAEAKLPSETRRKVAKKPGRRTRGSGGSGSGTGSRSGSRAGPPKSKQEKRPRGAKRGTRPRDKR